MIPVNYVEVYKNYFVIPKHWIFEINGKLVYPKFKFGPGLGPKFLYGHRYYVPAWTQTKLARLFYE